MTTTPADNEDETLRAMFADGVMLPLDVAVEAVDEMERLQLELELWQPWLQLADGELTRSERHEGSVGCLPNLRDTYAWLRLLMHSVQLKHDEDPEVPGSRLLFFMTAHAQTE